MKRSTPRHPANGRHDVLSKFVLLPKSYSAMKFCQCLSMYLKTIEASVYFGQLLCVSISTTYFNLCKSDWFLV